MEADRQNPEAQKAYSLPSEDPQQKIGRKVERTAKGFRGKAGTTGRARCPSPRNMTTGRWQSLPLTATSPP